MGFRKMRVPTAELPNMIIIVVPMFFAASSWFVYTFILQFTKAPVLLLLTISSLLSPLAFIIIGVASNTQNHGGWEGGSDLRWDNSQDLEWISCALRAVTAIFSLSIGGIGVYIVIAEARWHLPQELERSLQALQGSFMAGWAYFFALTFLGVTDWIMASTSKQLQFWNEAIHKARIDGRERARISSLEDGPVVGRCRGETKAFALGMQAKWEDSDESSEASFSEEVVRSERTPRSARLVSTQDPESISSMEGSSKRPRGKKADKNLYGMFEMGT